MMTFDFNVASLIPTIVAALLGLAVYRINESQKSREQRVDRIEERTHALELTVVRDFPNKEDFAGLSSRLDKLNDLFQEVRDMVIRLDERGKPHSTE